MWLEISEVQLRLMYLMLITISIDFTIAIESRKMTIYNVGYKPCIKIQMGADYVKLERGC